MKPASCILFFAALSATPLAAIAAERVTVANFARAETDTYNRAEMRAAGLGIGELVHIRQPMTAENQTVIRQNQDTLYSGVILDLAQPVTITLPEAGGRYLSMHVINQDHYMYVESAPGRYQLTEAQVGTRFARANFRIFVNPGDPADIEQAHAAQDGIAVEGGGNGPYEAPDWDIQSLEVARTALSNLAELGFNSRYAFGREDETRPVDFLIGAAAGWGGLPARAAMYDLNSVEQNDGQTPHSVSFRDVPVNAFWSFTVYDADGYLEKNRYGINSLNSVTAKANPDGSYTLNFGGDPGALNFLPISPGWNYVVRLYEPGPEIIDGSWRFPVPEPRP